LRHSGAALSVSWRRFLVSCLAQATGSPAHTRVGALVSSLLCWSWHVGVIHLRVAADHPQS
jgi:hypothetical protein